MKDFLHGRVSVAPSRPSATAIPIASHLPPIHHPSVTIEEPPPPPVEEPPLENAFEEPPPAPCLVEPQVEMVPDAEGRIGHIVVTCRCGEVITLQCNY
ncbi:MAG: hypothetical protein ACKOAS_03315 [Verrucomicrobiota bacterium]